MLESSRAKTAAAIGILFVFVLTLFLFTKQVRAPWFGNLKTYGHQFITGSTLTFVKSWVEDGIFKDQFKLLSEVKSALNQRADTLRHPYFTYPLGTFLPLFAFAKLHIADITPSTIMGWNLLNQFLEACTLTLIVFLATRKWGYSHLQALLFSLPVAFLDLFLPGPMYWHQNTFFADQAIIWPFTLIILTEVIGWYDLTEKQRKALRIAQGILLFIGTFTDWLFVFVTIVLAAIRLAQGKLGKKFWEIVKKTAALVWPSVLAVVVYFINALNGTTVGFLFHYALFRTALDAEGQSYTKGRPLNLWLNWLPLAYGRVGQYLIIGCLFVLIPSLIAALVWYLKKRKFAPIYTQMLSLATLALFTCAFQVTVFENHSVIHNFTSLKFVVPLSLFPFVLLPAWLLLRAEHRFPKITEWQAVLRVGLALVLLALAITYTQDQFPRYKDMFTANEFGPRIMGEAVHRNTTKADVLLSSELLIDVTVPYPMYYADTTMAKVFNWDDVEAVLAHSTIGDRIIFVMPKNKSWPKELTDAQKCAYETKEDAGYIFWYFKPSNFSATCVAQQ